MAYKFSPTSLALLKDCPRCFWLLFNKNIKRPEGIFPSLPSGIDHVLKEHFDSYMERHSLPPELKDLGPDVRLFDDAGQLKIWRSNLKGIQWMDDEGNILRGAVDNLLKKGDKLIVLDFKTRGYPLKEDTADHYRDQMDIYNFLLRKNGWKTEEYSYLLFYYPASVDENGNVIFKTELIDMQVSMENAERIFKEALKVLKEKIPPASEKCQFCKWCRDAAD